MQVKKVYESLAAAFENPEKVRSLHLNGYKCPSDEWICQLHRFPNLETLEIGWYFEPLELPGSVGDLSKLKSLRILNVAVVEMPEWLTNSFQLEHLVWRGTDLEKLDPSLARATNLRELDLGNNQIAHFPAELKALTKLKRLVVSDNQLTSFPAEAFHPFKELNLFNNPLCIIPAEAERIRRFQPKAFI